MNSSQLVGFYETFEKHAVYFRLQRDTMFTYGIATIVMLLFSLYVMKTSEITLLTSMRILMYCNVIAPAVACNILCLFLVPYILVPYPVLLNLALLHFGFNSTVTCCAIAFWSGVFSYFGIVYSISLKYITVCHFGLLRSTAFTIMRWIALVLPSILMISISIAVLILILPDASSIPSLLKADPRNALVVTDFAPLILYFISANGTDIWLMSVVVLYISTAILCVGMIIRIIIRIRSKEHEFSSKTYRLHLNVVLALLLYSAILLIQFGLPIIFFFTTVIFQLPLMNNLPYLETILLIPVSLTAISTSAMYLMVIRPFRQRAIQVIKRTLKCSMSSMSFCKTATSSSRTSQIFLNEMHSRNGDN